MTYFKCILLLLFYGNYVNCNQTFAVKLNVGVNQNSKLAQNNNKKIQNFKESSLRATTAEFVSGIERFLLTLSSPPQESESTGKLLLPPSVTSVNVTNGGAQVIKVLESESTRAGQFPFIASIKRDGSHLCGGIILDERHVLSASHCFDRDIDDSSGNGLEQQLSYYSVTLGEHDLKKTDRNEQTLRVEHICVHPQYDGFQGGNDIAILRLRRRIRFFGNVQPARLPSSGGEGVDVQRGAADVAGWGTTGYNVDMEKIRPNLLQTTHLFLFPQEDCTSFRGEVESIICAGDDGPNPRDVCAGDSGSPLICSGRVCGLVSYGARCLHNIERRRGVYTRLGYFSEWISRVKRAGGGRMGLCYKSS